MYLLDTNICIYIINKRSQNAAAVFASKPPFSIKLSAVTLAELEYGASKSRNRERNRLALLDFAAPFEILPFTEEDAEAFGVIRAALERAGRIIGAYDLQIAAQALRRDLTLVTNNTREFERVPELKLENWAV
jgi:tRNA(fMet)-specific endonuclease VapC